MDTALWILQVLLAVAFVGAGLMKLTQPKAKIAERMAWANDFSETQLKLIGLVELLGAVGLILPAVTRILPILTPLAAVGLVLTMIGAALTHIRRGEMPMVIPNIVLLALAAIVAYGRFVAFPL
ncbi:MAG: DoxX family protein [Chloroflexi bacterium]|nr:DoxX family protein [Chloroflexota bacterium]